MVGSPVMVRPQLLGLGRGQVGGEQAEDEPRRAFQDQVGGRRLAEPGADLTAGHLDDGGAAAGAQLDRERGAVRARGRAGTARPGR